MEKTLRSTVRVILAEPLHISGPIFLVFLVSLLWTPKDLGIVPAYIGALVAVLYNLVIWPSIRRKK